MNFAKRYFVVIKLTAYPCSCYVFNQCIYLDLCFLLQFYHMYFCCPEVLVFSSTAIVYTNFMRMWWVLRQSYARLRPSPEQLRCC